MIRDLMTPMRLGDPVVYRRHGGTIYGRIAGLEGDEYDGEHPILVLRTPHGSEVRAGRIWIAPITTPEDLAALADYEAQAAAPPMKSEENPMRLESITYECDWCKCREPATWSTHDDDEPPTGWWEIDQSMLCVACQAARKKAIEEARAARLNHRVLQGEDVEGVLVK